MIITIDHFKQLAVGQFTKGIGICILKKELKKYDLFEVLFYQRDQRISNKKTQHLPANKSGGSRRGATREDLNRGR